MRNGPATGGSPHGVGNVVFGAWLPTFERAGRGREGLRSQDRGYRARGRWTRTDPELRRVRPGDEGRGSGEDPDHEGPPPYGLRRSPQGMMRQGAEGSLDGASDSRAPGRLHRRVSKIGRASCRERVELGGGGGGVK